MTNTPQRHMPFKPQVACRKIKRQGMHRQTLRKWYSRRESNPQRPLRRGLLYPFNYGSVLNFIPATEIIVGKLFRGLLINLNGVKNPAPDIDNTGAPKSYSFCHISSNGLI